MGKKPVIIGLDRHLGGPLPRAGTDRHREQDSDRRISREFYKTTGKPYGKDEMWTFEATRRRGISTLVKENNILSAGKRRLRSS